MITKTLCIPEPPANTNIHAGTFTYIDKQGEAVTAEFYVRTCADNPEDSQVVSKRQNDLNQQFTDAWDSLRNEGDSKIAYKTLYPDPFF